MDIYLKRKKNRGEERIKSPIASMGPSFVFLEFCMENISMRFNFELSISPTSSS